MFLVLRLEHLQEKLMHSSLSWSLHLFCLAFSIWIGLKVSKLSKMFCFNYIILVMILIPDFSSFHFSRIKYVCIPSKMQHINKNKSKSYQYLVLARIVQVIKRIVVSREFILKFKKNYKIFLKVAFPTIKMYAYWHAC